MANKHANLPELFTDMADAIREKTGSSEQIVADNFPQAIANIETGAPNGRVFTRANVQLPGLNSMVYLNNYYIAGTDRGVLFVSTDGIQWMPRIANWDALAKGYGIKVIKFNQVCVAYYVDYKREEEGGNSELDTYFYPPDDIGCGVYYSNDGFNWLETEITQPLMDMDKDDISNTAIIGVGRNSIISSTDGINWTEIGAEILGSNISGDEAYPVVVSKVHCYSSNMITCSVIDYDIIYTEDGGNTWYNDSGFREYDETITSIGAGIAYGYAISNYNNIYIHKGYIWSLDNTILETVNAALTGNNYFYDNTKYNLGLPYILYGSIGLVIEDYDTGDPYVLIAGHDIDNNNDIYVTNYELLPLSAASALEIVVGTENNQSHIIITYIDYYEYITTTRGSFAEFTSDIKFADNSLIVRGDKIFISDIYGFQYCMDIPTYNADTDTITASNFTLCNFVYNDEEEWWTVFQTDFLCHNGILFNRHYGCGHYISLDNGKTWASNPHRLSFPIRGCGKLIAYDLCDKGIYSSTDGLNWNKTSDMRIGNSNSSGDDTGEVIKYANGLFVAGSTENGLVYSIGGNVWNEAKVDGTTGNENGIYAIYSLAYTNYKPRSNTTSPVWIMTSNKGIYFSTNGSSWEYFEDVSITSHGERRVLYHNGITVIYSDDDGIIAGTETLAVRLNIATDYVHYANGTWVAATSGGLYYSNDGITWTQSNVLVNCYGDTSIDYGDGLWVASSYSGLLYSTDNARTWTQSNITSDMRYTSIAYAYNIWIANNSYSRYYSIDGKTWTSITDSNINNPDGGIYLGNEGSGLRMINANGIWLFGGWYYGIWYSPTWEKEE